MLALVLAVVAAFHPGVPQPGGITALHGIKWKLHTGGPVVASPTLAGNRVYVGSYDGNLYALEAASGAVAWKVDLGARVASSAAVSDGVVYVLGYDAKLHALDAATGKSKWTFATRGEHRFTATHLHGALPVAEAMPDPFDVFLSSPQIAGGVVYFGSSDGNVYALDANTGSQRWKFQTGDVVHASPAIADGRVFVGSWDGNFYALDAATGALAWTLEAGRDPKIHNQQGFQASALVVGGRVLVGCRDSIFYALDAKTGAKLWTMSNHGSWVVGSASARGDAIYFATSDSGKLYGVDAKTGAKQLELDFHTWPMFSSPAIAGSMLYIGSNRGTLDAIDLDAKRVAWSFSTDGAKANAATFTKPDGSPNYDAAFAGSFYDELVAGVAKLAALGQIQSSPAIGDGVIYVGSTDGNVYALN